MEFIHSIEGDKIKIKLAPCKIKQPNVKTVSVIKGGKYTEVQFAKYVHSFQEGKLHVQVNNKRSLAYMWTILRGICMIKGKAHMKPFNSDCVYPIWFSWLPRSTWHMSMTDDIKY